MRYFAGALFAVWGTLPVAVAVVIFVAGCVMLLYNRLVRHANLVREAWSGIDVQLKCRHDLVLNLVETVKGYAGFEQSLLKRITELRSRALADSSIEDRQEDENSLTRCLKSLFAVVEDYPELKANQSFLDLHNQLAEIEQNLQMARRYHNGTVRDYNIRVESFPSNLVAKVFRFEQAVYFQVG